VSWTQFQQIAANQSLFAVWHETDACADEQQLLKVKGCNTKGWQTPHFQHNPEDVRLHLLERSTGVIVAVNQFANEI